MNPSANPDRVPSGEPATGAPDSMACEHPAMTGLKIVVNGRTVVHRHFLQQAMDAMVRRAVAEESLASPG